MKSKLHSSTEEDGGGSVISMATAAAEGSASSGITPVAKAAADGDHRRRQRTLFKGVVLQHNGHWGAQIYANHQRIWLGTFRSEQAAAMAYDSAAAKIFHSTSSSASGHHRNFQTNEKTACELDFQDKYSTEDVLAMIRDGSYQPKLDEFLCGLALNNAAAPAPAAAAAPRKEKAVGVEGHEVREMFEKELTPSDVGKLNRLVIPKKQALRHLPAVSGEEELMVECRDREGRAWEFRYCYWKSSQSYVFTKGWNRFVKGKGLRAKDVVGFYRCVEKEGLGRSYTMIDVVARDRVNGGGGEEGERVVVVEEEEEEVVSPAVATIEEERKKKKVKLFGAWIG